MLNLKTYKKYKKQRKTSKKQEIKYRITKNITDLIVVVRNKIVNHDLAYKLT